MAVHPAVTAHVRPLRRLILRCRMCDPAGVLIEPTSGHATFAAADHALDEHRERLIEDPDGALGALSVAA